MLWIERVRKNRVSWSLMIFVEVRKHCHSIGMNSRIHYLIFISVYQIYSHIVFTKFNQVNNKFAVKTFPGDSISFRGYAKDDFGVQNWSFPWILHLDYYNFQNTDSFGAYRHFDLKTPKFCCIRSRKLGSIDFENFNWPLGFTKHFTVVQ